MKKCEIWRLKAKNGKYGGGTEGMGPRSTTGFTRWRDTHVKYFTKKRTSRLERTVEVIRSIRTYN